MVMRKKANMCTNSLIGFKIKIFPTDDQKIEINRNIHTARAVYNLGLEMQNKSYQDGNGYIGFYQLITEFSKLRNSDADKKWLQSISIGTIRETLHNLDNAFMRFFNKQNKYPKFKSRKTSKKSFTVRSDRTRIYGNYISISGLENRLVLAKNHNIPDNVRLHNTVVSFDGINYWFSCAIEKEEEEYKFPMQEEPVGIDVGIVNMITSSDGTFYKFSDCTKYEKRRKRQDKRLSKYYQKYYEESVNTRTKYEDIQKSKNYSKRIKDRLKTIFKIRNKYRNDIHTATREIINKNPSAIVIENISVREQQKDKFMRKYSPQMMYYEIHRQIKYKSANAGIPVLIADRNFPSSQICSRCGNRGYLKRRIFKCPHCGFKEDRDLNAAINLRNLAYQQVPNENGIVYSIDA